jgi:hypothetical protein
MYRYPPRFPRPMSSTARVGFRRTRSGPAVDQATHDLRRQRSLRTTLYGPHHFYGVHAGPVRHCTVSGRVIDIARSGNAIRLESAVASDQSPKIVAATWSAAARAMPGVTWE